MLLVNLPLLKSLKSPVTIFLMIAALISLGCQKKHNTESGSKKPLGNHSQLANTAASAKLLADFSSALKTECGIENYQEDKKISMLSKGAQDFSGSSDKLLESTISDLDFKSLVSTLKSSSNIADSFNINMIFDIIVELLESDALPGLVEAIDKSGHMKALTKVIIEDQKIVEVLIDIGIQLVPLFRAKPVTERMGLAKKTFTFMKVAVTSGLVLDIFRGFNQSRTLKSLIQDFVNIAKFLSKRDSSGMTIVDMIDVLANFIQQNPQVMGMVEDIGAFLPYKIEATVSNKIDLETTEAEYFYYVNKFDNLTVDLLDRSGKLSSLLLTGIDLIGKRILRHRIKFDVLDLKELYKANHAIEADQRCHFAFAKEMAAESLYKSVLEFEQPIPFGFNPLSKKYPKATHEFTTKVTIKETDHPNYKKGDSFTVNVKLSSMAINKLCAGSVKDVDQAYMMSYKVEKNPKVLADLGLFTYIAGGFDSKADARLTSLMHNGSTAIFNGDLCSK